MQEDKIVLKSGRVFKESEIKSGADVGVISRRFAEKNNITVGDTLQLDNVAYQPSQGDESTREIYKKQRTSIEVIGIVEQKIIPQETNGNERKDTFTSRQNEEKENTILAPNNFVAKENTYRYEMMIEQDPTAADNTVANFASYEPIFILKQSEDVELFRATVAPLLPQFYQVTVSSDAFESISGSILTMKSLSLYTLNISVWASLFILSLLILLLLRERKQEFGIYLSLGEQKRKILAQILLEVILIGFVAITCSLFSGNMIARAISDQIIVDKMVNSNKEGEGSKMIGSTSLDILGYGTSVTAGEVIDKFSINFDPEYMIMFYLVGIGTMSVSTISPMIYILRLQPKKIMLS